MFFSVHTRKTYIESRGIAPFTTNHGNEWRLVIKFMARPLSAVRESAARIAQEVEMTRDSVQRVSKRRKIPCPAGILTPDSTVRNLIPIPTTLSCPTMKSKWMLMSQGESTRNVFMCLRDGDRWRAFLHTAMKQQVPQNAANFQTTLRSINFLTI